MIYNYQWYALGSFKDLIVCRKCNKIVPWNLLLCTNGNPYCNSCYDGKIYFSVKKSSPFLRLYIRNIYQFDIENKTYLYDDNINKSNVKADDYILMKELYLEFVVKKPVLSPKYYDIEFDFHD